MLTQWFSRSLSWKPEGSWSLVSSEDQRVDAAPRTAADDADQPPDRVVVEVGREVGDDEDAERLGDLAGHRVVFLDRLELVAQVLLDDVLHVLGQVGQPLLDVGRLGPDAAGDQELVVVGQVHEGGEVLAQADGVDDGEADLAGRDRGQEAEHQGLEQGDGLVLAAVGRADEHRALHGERQEGGQVEVGRHRLEPRVARHAVGELAQVDREAAEPQAGRDLGRRLPAVELRPVPVEESPRGLLVDPAQGLVDPRHAAGPVVDQVLPGLVVGLLGGLLDLAVRLVELLLVLGRTSS